jgi:diamine N-acetyltransferase
MNVNFNEIGIQDIIRIKQLWSKLNAIHSVTSPFFSDEYASKSFDHRVDELSEKSRRGIIKIFIAQDKDTDIIIGYCVCSSIESTGEIDSIFVEDEYRKNKIGDMLLSYAEEFFNSNSVSKRVVCVYIGNEQVMNFYNRHHYYQKYITLEKRGY